MLIFRSIRRDPDRQLIYFITTSIYKKIFGKYILKEYFEYQNITTRVEITKEQYEQIKNNYAENRIIKN